MVGGTLLGPARPDAYGPGINAHATGPAVPVRAAVRRFGTRAHASERVRARDRVGWNRAPGLRGPRVLAERCVATARAASRRIRKNVARRGRDGRSLTLARPRRAGGVAALSGMLILASVKAVARAPDGAACPPRARDAMRSKHGRGTPRVATLPGEGAVRERVLERAGSFGPADRARADDRIVLLALHESDE